MNGETEQREFRPWIVCAANKHPETGLVICGARHYDSAMREVMYKLGGFPYWSGCEQGFIDQFGKFYDRAAAFEIAEANGQIKEKHPSQETRILYSEDLY